MKNIQLILHMQHQSNYLFLVNIMRQIGFSMLINILICSHIVKQETDSD